MPKASSGFGIVDEAAGAGGRFLCGGAAADRPPHAIVASMPAIRIVIGSFRRIDWDSFYPVYAMIVKRSLNPSIGNQPDQRYQNIKHVGYPLLEERHRDGDGIKKKGKLSFLIAAYGRRQFRVL